ncbi:phage portal protein family protein, partial [Marinimicrobium sp. UBA4209]
DLKEPQTADRIALQREFQGHPSRGLTPSKLAQIMDSAEQGDIMAQYELYEDMEEKDAHIMAEMGKRRRAVAGLDWSIVPPRNPTAKEKNAARELQEVIAGLEDFAELMFDVTDGIGKAFCCLEIEWRRSAGF